LRWYEACDSQTEMPLDNARRLLLPLALIASSSFLAACGEGGEGDEGEGGVVSSSLCLSGKQWAGGDEESPLMHPGLDCITCHANEHEGPSYVAAGTVYGAYDEPDDCLGVAGVLVEIFDGDGAAFTTTTNDAGNFWIQQPIAPPITARVTYEGQSLEMTTQQPLTNCASCHTATGANQAAGRIVVP